MISISNKDSKAVGASELASLVPLEITKGGPSAGRTLVSVEVVQAGSEDGGAQASVFRIERQGSPAKELVIPYQIFGTATPNIDYALPEGSSIQDGLVQGVVVLQPDENAVSLTLPTLVDGFVDAGESIQVWLQPPTDDSYNILPGGQRAGLILGAEQMAAVDGIPTPPNSGVGTNSYHNIDALALHRNDGSIAFWGASDKGGALGDVDLNGPNDDLTILQVVSTSEAMAALRSDGTVVSWGSKFYGGDSKSLNFRGEDSRQRAIELVADDNRMYALLSDGTALMWGLGAQADGAFAESAVRIIPTDGSDGAVVIHKDGHLSIPVLVGSKSQPPVVLVEINHPDFASVVDVRESNGNYLALRSDGSAVTWGPRGEAVMHLLADKDLADPLQKDVVAIADGNVAGSGFSVLLRDGRIITWSTPDSDSGVRTELVNKSYSVFYGDEVKFTSLVGGFGGITEAGELIQWSPYTTSEDIFVEPETEYLSNGWATQRSLSGYVREASSPVFEPVVDLVHNRVALRADGSVIAWGNATNGGYNPSAQEKHDLLALGHLNGSSNKNDRQKIVKVVQSSYSATGGNANEIAFAALRADGSVLTWGNSKFGGTAETALGDANNNLIADSLESGVVDIYGFWDGFIALMHDGTVQRWSSRSGSRGIFSGYLGVDFDGDGRVNSDDEAPFDGPLAAVGMVHPASAAIRNASEPTWLIDGKAWIVPDEFGTLLQSTEDGHAITRMDDGSLVLLRIDTNAANHSADNSDATTLSVAWLRQRYLLSDFAQGESVLGAYLHQTSHDSSTPSTLLELVVGPAVAPRLLQLDLSDSRRLPLAADQQLMIERVSPADIDADGQIETLMQGFAESLETLRYFERVASHLQRLYLLWQDLMV